MDRVPQWLIEFELCLQLGFLVLMAGTETIFGSTITTPEMFSEQVQVPGHESDYFASQSAWTPATFRT